jgi:hypothetical protein
MRLLGYHANGRLCFGAAVAGGVVDLTRRIGTKFPDLRTMIAGDGLSSEPSTYKNEVHK